MRQVFVRFSLSFVYRIHLAEDAGLYSMEDLIGVKKGSLVDLLEEVWIVEVV